MPSAVGLASLVALQVHPCSGGFEYDPELRIESARLFGNLNQYAYYFTDLMVGLPNSQRVSVIIDTGSRLVGFPCTGCGHCGDHLDPAFDISASETARWFGCEDDCAGCTEGRCPYSETYAEGSSIAGFWFDDFMELGDPFSKNPAVRVQMGCHNSEDNLFYTQQANGIMGLAPSTGQASQPTVLQQMFRDRKHVDTKVFSICLATWGGRITIGGFNSSYHIVKPSLDPIQWVDMRATQYYFVKPEALSIIDFTERIEVVRGVEEFGVSIVDSGTTYTYLPDDIFTSLMSSLRDYCTEHNGCGADQESDRCWRLRDADEGPAGFPPIAFHFEGDVRVDWMPHNYLQQRKDGALWCRTFMANSIFQTVLGISLMLHKDFIFDLGRGRLGIADAQCPEYTEQPPEDARALHLPQRLDNLAQRDVPPRLGAPMREFVELGSTGSGSAAPAGKKAVVTLWEACACAVVVVAALFALSKARIRRSAALDLRGVDEESIAILRNSSESHLMDPDEQ
jgi:hypothetical protein